MKKICFLSTILFSILLYSCRTVPKVSWNDIPKSNYSVIVMDLSSPNLEIHSYPEESGWTETKAVKEFAKETDCSVALNANPFEKKNPLAKKAKLIGTHVVKGKELAEQNPKYAKISFYREESGFSAKIYDSQTENETAVPEFSAGGFWTILRGDRIFQFKNRKDNRVAAGTSENGRILYLLSGKKLSFMDCAEILRQQGAYSAMEFDGGHHCNLFYNGKNSLKYPFAQKPAAILGFKNILSIKID